MADWQKMWSGIIFLETTSLEQLTIPGIELKTEFVWDSAQPSLELFSEESHLVQIKFNVDTLNLNKLWALVSLNTSICAENNHLINSGEMAYSVI